MQVDDIILNSIAFLGAPNERGGFTAVGTGFFFGMMLDEADFVYLVTCKHVVEPFVDERKQVPNNEPIWIRVGRETGPPYLVKTQRSDWICHADRFVDVCVYPCDVGRWEAEAGKLTVSPLERETIVFTPELQEHHGKLWLGDELFIPGVFVGRVGDQRNIPVVRIATVAALPYEPIDFGSPRHPAYLVETKSLGGASGSPVFLHTEQNGRTIGNWQRRPHPSGKGFSFPYFLIGMMQGTHSGQYAKDFTAADASSEIVPKDADFNAGLAIVLPYTDFLEVLDLPVLHEARMATLEAKKKDSGYRPASAKRAQSEPSTTQDNPSHKEDFTHLLHAAVKAPKSAD